MHDITVLLKGIEVQTKNAKAWKTVSQVILLAFSKKLQTRIVFEQWRQVSVCNSLQPCRSVAIIEL